MENSYRVRNRFWNSLKQHFKASIGDNSDEFDVDAEDGFETILNRQTTRAVRKRRNNSYPPPEHTSSKHVNECIIKKVKPMYPELARFQSRMETYEEWPQTSRKQPNELARAGLFYTGKSDKVLCFSCGGGLYHWEEEDDAVYEHLNRYPHCCYARLCNSNTLPLRTNSTSQKRNLSHIFHSNEDDDEIFYEDNENVFNSDSHSKHRPRRFTTTDESYLNKTPTKELSKRVESFSVRSEDVQEPSVGITSCTICKSRERSDLFLPCGHLITCTNCATTFGMCPVCQCLVKGRIKVFLT